MNIAKPEILYEDLCIIVCLKPPGVSSETPGMPELLADETGARQIFCVHRLDMGVGGVMVYAKTKKAAAELSRQIAERELEKEYLAAVSGVPEEPRGVMRDLLLKDSKSGKSFVVSRVRGGVKQAELFYELEKTVFEKEKPMSLIKIRLHTGRSHQIRVQLASRKMPLLGDGKYGSREKRCKTALWSFSLGFKHPESGKPLRFSAMPPKQFPWELFLE